MIIKKLQQELEEVRRHNIQLLNDKNELKDIVYQKNQQIIETLKDQIHKNDDLYNSKIYMKDEFDHI